MCSTEDVDMQQLFCSVKTHTVCALTLWIANFRNFCFFIFIVWDVTTHPLPKWSKFLWDETFADTDAII